ncbi:uncharacterized protein LOC134276284 [Saccostrea cucullata]|uniref:uncharacterized protein LOC134276284 n=1 Tax=Saccostrea cuccullata TaxID=36930 RepID=UPI002ED3ACD2
MDDGFVVDLTSVSRNDQTPYFQDVPNPGSNNELYSFNPCSGFTEGTGSCSDVTLCLITVSGPIKQYKYLGSKNTSSFSMNDNIIDMYYSDGDGGTSSVVHISCNDGTLGTFFEPKGSTGGPYVSLL